MKKRTRNPSLGLALALAATATAIAPAAAQAAPPTCSDMNVGVPHNTATPIFVACTGGTGTGSPDIEITDSPGKGTLSVLEGARSTDQWVVYTPDPGEAGTDSFQYEGVSPDSGPLDSDERSPERTVRLRIAQGTPPVCANLSQSVPQNVATNLRFVCASGGDPITSYAIADAPDNGTLGTTSLNSGLVSYTSGAAFSGADSLRYTATSTCGATSCLSNQGTFDLMVLNPQQGPTGPAGEDGEDGAPGTPGTNGAPGATGPAGATGATGPAGSTGAQGATGLAGANGAAGQDGVNGADGRVVTTPRLMVASFLDALTARTGKSVLLRYVATTDARVILEVFKGKRRVASVPGRAREGRNAIRWNGKAGKRAAGAGLYRLLLRATSGGQVVSDAATVRLTGASSSPRTGNGGAGGGGSGGVGEG